MFSKTLILSSQEKFVTNSPRAILTIIKEKNKTTGKIRLYNLKKLDNSVALGIFCDQNVFKSGLNYVGDHYEFEVKEDINISNDIYCALIDTQKQNEVVLCGGSYSGMYFTDEESPFDELEEETIQQIDQEIAKDDIDESPNCKNCEYKNTFFEQTNTTQDNEPLIAETTSLSETIPASEQDNNYLSSVVEQLEEMFKEYPLDEQIMSIIPNSKIIKVEDIENNSYIVGTLFDADGIKYLLYGVPARNNTAPPKEFDGNYQWLALDPDDPLSDGYYLLYTDITNGKPVKLKVE